MFAKRHYEFLAEFFVQQFNDPQGLRWADLDILLDDLANKLQAENPKFKRQRFLLAAHKGISYKVR